MEEKYRIILFRYIYNELNLKIIESLLMKHHFDYIENEKLMGKEEKICYPYSKYFYLLNEITIDNLDKEEKEYLSSINENSDINKEVITFLKKTINKVLFKDAKGKDIYYGPHSKQFLSKDNVIVLGLKRDEFGFAKTKIKKRNEIETNDKVISEILSSIQNNTEYTIQIILYNELFEKMNGSMRIKQI